MTWEADMRKSMEAGAKDTIVTAVDRGTKGGVHRRAETVH